MSPRTAVASTIALVACLAGARVCAAEAVPGSRAESPLDQALDQAIVQQMEEGGIVGVGAAILVDRKVVWSKGYGFADRERAIPFTPDTVMNIGSISKTVTGVAMMQAVQDGKLDLDRDINAYLPFRVVNPFHPNDTITLRQLATHTSGITDRWSVYRATYHYDGDAPEPLGDFLRGYFVAGGKDYARDNFLDVAPGSHREYSNIGAGLAGYIVERAVGMPLPSYARQRIFAPLGMQRTGWSIAEIPPDRHARLYVAQDGLTMPIPLYEGTTYPDGGVRTSVADLSRLFAALLDEGAYDSGRILQATTAREMLRFQYDATRKPDNVDLREINSGLFWATKFDVTRIGHNGSDPGVRTEMLSNLSRDLGVVLFTNTSLSGEAQGAYVAIHQALWKHAEALKKARTMP